MSESDLWKSNEYLRERNEELEHQSKETEEKIKEIIKDIEGRKEHYEKVRKAHKKDKDISGLYFCIGLLCQCERDLDLIYAKFPEYFKESDLNE